MEIKNLRKKNNGSFVADFNVLANVSVNDVAVKQTQDGKVFFDMPGRLRKLEDGKFKKYSYAIPTSKEQTAEITKKVMEAMDGTDNDTARYFRAARSEKSPALVGFCQLTGEFSVSCSLRKKQDGTYTLSFPQKSYEVDGEKKYSSYIIPSSKEVYAEILQAAIEAYEKAE